MSDSAWTPIHHEDFYEEQQLPAGADPATPGTDREQTPRRARANGEEKQQSPVGLMLDLPRDFISATWGCFEQLTRVATAIEENNKLLAQVLKSRDT